MTGPQRDGAGVTARLARTRTAFYVLLLVFTLVFGVLVGITVGAVTR